MIDLHTHSTASDGTLSPAELALRAKENGLSAVALTDHDTVEGIAEFKEAGKKLGLEAISGVEISAKYKKEMHILGLFVDETDTEFIQTLSQLRDSREIRNRTMLQKAMEHGLNISEADIRAQKEGATLYNTGRAHIARALVDKGYVRDIQEAFDRYLSKGKPCYAERRTFSPEDSIKLIHRAGGIAVLAHPVFITTDEKELTDLLRQLQTYGLDGVECYYSEYTQDFQQLCLKICENLGLLVSGGSDFHGDNKPHIRIGHVTDGNAVEDAVLETIKQYRD